MSSQRDQSRYNRQMLVHCIGEQGQSQIGNSVAVVIGLGALGSTVANYLARAGVGTLRLVDRDVLEWSNLQRQVLYDEDDVRESRPKAVAAELHLRKINSDINYESMVTDVNPDNIERVIKDATVVVDGLDNLYTRALINQACTKSGIPWIHGACVSTYGMTMTIVPGKTACYECLFPGVASAPRAETCDTAGVLGPLAGVIASLESAEAIKILSGHLDAVSTQVRYLDVWRNTIDFVDVKRDPGCSVCGSREFPLLSQAPDLMVASLCGRNAVQVVPRTGAQSFDFDAAATRLSRLGRTKVTPHLAEVELDDTRLCLFKDGRAIVFGTADFAKARSIYTRYVGG